LQQDIEEPDGRIGEPEALQYPECSGGSPVAWWSAWNEVPASRREGAGASTWNDGRESAKPEEPAFDPRQSEEIRRLIAEARAESLAEGRRLEREAHAAAKSAAESQRARQMAALTETFAIERDRYLKAIEEEVVHLALAIAARILRREAQADPLLLLGAVRVALGQVAASSELRLRVPAADLDLWTAALALLPHQNVKPTVIAGEGMRLGDCTIETSLGKADLSVRGQLGEIARNLFEGGSAAGAESESRRQAGEEAAP
jgi:flagellar biosynthesis/type III secretory pathway protein FliH